MYDLRFNEVVESYRLYCRARGLAQKTMERYFSSLEALRAFLAREDGDPQVSPFKAQLRASIAFMLDRGLSRGMIRVRMRAVRTFCAFLVREAVLAENPFTGVEIPGVPNVYPTVLNVDERSKPGASLRAEDVALSAGSST